MSDRTNPVPIRLPTSYTIGTVEKGLGGPLRIEVEIASIRTSLSGAAGSLDVMEHMLGAGSRAVATLRESLRAIRASIDALESAAGLEETEPRLRETDITLCPGLFVKSTRLPLGEAIPQHAHGYAHISVVAAGAVRLFDGSEPRGEYRAPSGIVIPARRAHTFLAIEPDTVVLCIHRVGADGEPEIIEEG